MDGQEDERVQRLGARVGKIISWIQRRCVHYLCLYGHEECALAIIMLDMSNLAYLVLYKFLVRLNAKPFTADHVKIQEFVAKIIEDDRLSMLRDPHEEAALADLDTSAARESETS